MATMTVAEGDTLVELEEALADVDGALVAAVDAERAAASEMLTAAARRTGPDSYAITAPREFRFERLRDAMVIGLGIWVGDWFGVIPIGARRTLPGDVLTIALPGWVA
jgi:hypothetical protein